MGPTSSDFDFKFSSHWVHTLGQAVHWVVLVGAQRGKGPTQGGFSAQWGWVVDDPFLSLS